MAASKPSSTLLFLMVLYYLAFAADGGFVHNQENTILVLKNRITYQLYNESGLVSTHKVYKMVC